MTLLIEDYVPVVKYNGLNTAKDVSITGNLTVTGTTNIGNISLADLSTTGNTTLGNASTDTLGVNGNATFTPPATGNGIDVVATAKTTGNVFDVSDANALTTGSIANLTSNSADVTARNLVKIVNDNTAAVGAVPLYLQQDAVGTANFKTLIILGTIGIYTSNETSPDTLLTAAKGSICLNGSATGQAFWNTDGATAWTALA